MDGCIEFKNVEDTMMFLDVFRCLEIRYREVAGNCRKIGMGMHWIEERRSYGDVVQIDQ